MRRPVAGDLSGAVADLGIFVPLVAALILVNGLQPGPLLLVAGLLSLLSGLWFRIPFPVQPLKALTALAVAQQLEPDVIHAAGLLIGLTLIVLTVTGLADRVARVFTRGPVDLSGSTNTNGQVLLAGAGFCQDVTKGGTRLLDGLRASGGCSKDGATEGALSSARNTSSRSMAATSTFAPLAMSVELDHSSGT